MNPEQKSLLWRKRMQLWKECDGRCFYCGCDTYLPGAGESKQDGRARLGLTAGVPGSKLKFRMVHATIEHLQRKVDQGTNKKENLRMSCFACNNRRGEMSPEDFKAYVQQLIREGKHWNVKPQFNEAESIALNNAIKQAKMPSWMTNTFDRADGTIEDYGQDATIGS